MAARRSDVVRAMIHPVAEFGGDDRLVAPADQRGAKLFLGDADAVAVGGVEVVDALPHAQCTTAAAAFASTKSPKEKQPIPISDTVSPDSPNPAILACRRWF